MSTDIFRDQYFYLKNNRTSRTNNRSTRDTEVARGGPEAERICCTCASQPGVRRRSITNAVKECSSVLLFNEMNKDRNSRAMLSGIPDHRLIVGIPIQFMAKH